MSSSPSAPRARVFAALPEQLERWIATDATVEPQVGGRYDLDWTTVRSRSWSSFPTSGSPTPGAELGEAWRRPVQLDPVTM